MDLDGPDGSPKASMPLRECRLDMVGNLQDSVEAQ
jgi:hypothetical protein